MSKIQKALEKAKQKRQPAEPGDQTETPAATSPLLDQPPVYQHTQALPVDRCHLEKHRIMTLTDDTQATDCYNLLRTQILMRTRDQSYNTLMVTSALEGEGKTITAINLAVSIARDVQQTVLLVDTDLRNPRVHHFLGCSVTRGLADYLLEDVPLPELLIHPGLAKMVLLPAGKPLSGSTDLLGSPKMERLVQELKSRYPDRYVIFDCPPLLTAPDSLVFSSYVDGIVFVAQAGRTPRDDIRKSVELLDGRNIVGLVMNRGELTRQYYYHTAAEGLQ